MTKQKEKAPDGDNARVRFALYSDEATLEQVKQNYKQDGCGCMSEYITKAIRYYTELHSLADCSHVVPDIIASTLKDITRESDNRQGRLLFKLAVELAILQNVVAANYGISKTDLERLRGICVNEVKKSTAPSLLTRQSDGKADSESQLLQARTVEINGRLRQIYRHAREC